MRQVNLRIPALRSSMRASISNSGYPARPGPIVISYRSFGVELRLVVGDLITDYTPTRL